ncbi:MAG: hypothetical protein GY749_13920 [Desulfobacteraceae bacterium]|nr:hypothetical protein [Desulfobacteraceae bacterium]
MMKIKLKILCYTILSVFICQPVFAMQSDYYGSAAIDSPAGLGNIDLAFHLEVFDNGDINSARSYIIAEKTILFPKAGQIDGKDTGPMVQSGNLELPYNGTDNFVLATRTFTGTVTNKTVKRTITLTGKTDTGDMIEGTYIEEITGYLPTKLTVTGTFVLIRPISRVVDLDRDVVEPFNELTIEEIRRGDDDVRAVEFEDVSCAIHFLKNPEPNLTVSESTVVQAIQEYREYLKNLP